MFTNIPRAIRFLRLRRGWSQTVLGARAGVSRELISRLERRELAGVTVGSVERVLAALGASARFTAQWQGEQLERLMDAGHAALQETVAQLLTSLGWIVRVEVSFNRYGDRGRVDILAFRPAMRIVLVVEVKTAIGDLQETIGRLDVKVRIAPLLAREAGWGDPAAVLPLLVILDGPAARRIVANHAALFARLSLRGRRALAWLRRPLPPSPTGLLWFAKTPDSREVTNPHGRRPSKPPSSHST